MKFLNSLLTVIHNITQGENLFGQFLYDKSHCRDVRLIERISAWDNEIFQFGKVLRKGLNCAYGLVSTQTQNEQETVVAGRNVAARGLLNVASSPVSPLLSQVHLRTVSKPVASFSVVCVIGIGPVEISSVKAVLTRLGRVICAVRLLPNNCGWRPYALMLHMRMVSDRTGFRRDLDVVVIFVLPTVRICRNGSSTGLRRRRRDWRCCGTAWRVARSRNFT